MKLYYVNTGLLHVNSYFLVDEATNEAVLIDCGEYYNKIMNVASKFNFKIIAVLLTHAHFDHVLCAKKLQDDGAKIYVSETDANKIINGEILADHFKKPFDKFIPDKTFSDGEELKFASIKIKCLITPGHTDGSACFICGDNLFTGDTLFLQACGRIDFPTGNGKQMKASLERLYALEGDYIVYPGHNEFTTLENERKFNVAKYL